MTSLSLLFGRTVLANFTKHISFFGKMFIYIENNPNFSLALSPEALINTSKQGGILNPAKVHLQITVVVNGGKRVNIVVPVLLF